MVHDRKMSDPVVIENTFELSAFMKAGVMATDSERDSGCSADEDSRSSLHSPTGSEDSVEMPVTPISLRNKRKLAEPRKLQEPTKIAAPLKKRRFDSRDSIAKEMTTVGQQVDARSMSKPSPFRPWIRMSKNASKTAATPPAASDTSITVSDATTVTPLTNEEEERGTNQRAKGSEEEEEEEKGQDDEMSSQRLSIERLQCANGGHDRSAASSRRESHHRSVEAAAAAAAAAATLTMSPTNHLPARLQNEPLSLVVRDEAPRVPAHPAVSGGTYEKAPSYMMDHLLGSLSSRDHSNHRNHHQVHQVHQAHQVSSSSSHRHQHQGGQQRNYKNMTRERRIEANARERTRVHTISAAFDTLRRAIPAYSHNQKLSKLSVLRIACSYIMMLSRILDKDEDAPIERENDLANCVDLVSKTIQTEGKLRKRKDD